MRIPVGVLVIVKLASGEVERTRGEHFIGTSWMWSAAACFECLPVFPSMSEGGLDQP